MDARLFHDVNRLAIETPWAHGLMKAFANYGVVLFAILVLGTWWYARSLRGADRAVAASIWAGVAALAAVLVNQPFVSLFHRARPYHALHGVEVLVSRSNDFSFPSDHAVTAGAAMAGLWLVAFYGQKAARRLAMAGTILAVLVAFSRVYVGAHYPGDVAVGLLLGSAVTLVGWMVVKRPATAAVEAIGRRGPPLGHFVRASPRPEALTKAA